MTGAAADVAEQERLAALAAYDLVGIDDSDPVLADLRGLCELAATVLDVPTAVVNLIDDRFQHQVGAFGFNATLCERDQAMCQTTLASGQDIYLPDASGDVRFVGSPWVDGRLAGIRFYCSTILRTPAGHAVGTLCVFSDERRDPAESQLAALRMLGRQVVDVLELRLRTRQLEGAYAELRRSQDRLASFAGQISHDLKAPITAILGFTELLDDLDPIVEDPSASAYVARCSSAARRMLAMIDDMLAFARVGGTLSPAVNTVATVVAEVVDDLGALADGADITASGPDVVADRAQFRALVQNLVANGLIYRGDTPSRIQVSSEHVGDTVVLRVIDNGVGIPAESREDVLRPLVRLGKELPGAGLGLAVCVRVAAAHGGSLRLDATPGGGTTAVVTLPLP
jgi:signal transduction histidine kinase